jgi:hypothetical protein
VNDLKSNGFLIAYHMRTKKGQELEQKPII